MGKTFKDRRYDDDDHEDWRREREQARRDKKIKRGGYAGKRVERAKGEGN